MRTKTLVMALCAALVVAGSLPAGASAQRRGKQGTGKGAGRVQAVRIDLTERGYEPAGVRLRPGVPARVTFTRKVSATCATEVVLPDYAIRRALPLDELVVVEFTPKKSGEYTFSCGMGMLRGMLIVK
jgi:plastocyanin domain-containing protein